MFKNALISVSDKSGLIEFIKPLADQGMRVVSTGGTYEYLKKNGIAVIDISEQTGFPEVMGGRVKTLHPRVHMALLSRPGVKEDDEILKKEGLEPFDLLVCNLYPFEKALQEGAEGAALIEKIDIGGPTLLRASAKNFSRMSVVCDPKDYSWILKKQNLELEDRKKLAAKVFSHVSVYDSMIAEKLMAEAETFSIGGYQVMELRYGENPQQKAAWYRKAGALTGLHQSEVLQGKPLSFNNILDLEAASLLVRQFSEPATVAVKHNNPCGVAIDRDLSKAVEKALKADPVSVFGGIVACNRTIEATEAKLLSNLFLECIVAPYFSKEALDIFAVKKNLRILKWEKMLESSSHMDLRSVSGGFLIQETDLHFSDPKEWKVIGEKPTAEIEKDLLFAEKVCASLKSNAIAIVKNGQSVGLGMGQVNRVEAVQHAIDRMKTHFTKLEGSILASDAFFPFPDSIEKAAAAGVRWILQPGGSVKDEEVIAAAQRLGVNMVLTGQRHFRH